MTAAHIPANVREFVERLAPSAGIFIDNAGQAGDDGRTFPVSG